MAYLVLFLTSNVYILMQVGYKYNIPQTYEDWYDKQNIIVRFLLPKDYCELCIVFRLSQTVSIIVALLLGLPLLTTITLGTIVSALVLLSLKI